MHPDLERLISIAKESGELTEKQKVIILRKAKALGEDLDEVEFVLETLKSKEPVKAPSGVPKLRKCPHCGATISGYSLTCPECGFSLSSESKTSENVRNYVQDLQILLMEAENSVSARDQMLYGDQKVCQQKVNIITTFQLPYTTEALLEMMLFTYSSYQTAPSSLINVNRRHLKNAWLGKAKQAYRMLAAQSDLDEKTKATLQEYSFLAK